MKNSIRLFIPIAAVLTVVCLAAWPATANTVEAVYHAATDVPVTADGYTATGSTVGFTLNFAPETGAQLMLVKNTGPEFIDGAFDNLAQGQAVALSYGGVTYRFVANYYGGSGNDLVLVWASSRAFGWGWNQLGQLGNDTIETSRLQPAPVTTTGVLGGRTVAAVAAGDDHSLALCTDGTVASWGYNQSGQLGSDWCSFCGPCRVPLAVNTVSNLSALYGKRVVAIAAGRDHSLALCADGTVAAWGYNASGQLGDNSITTRYRAVAVNTNTALFGRRVVAIAAGYVHSLALCSDGTVAEWGNGATHQVPWTISATAGASALYGKTVVALAGGQQFSLALCSDGTVVGWGKNSNGQLGNNSTTTPNYPVAVNTNAGVSALHGKTVVAIAAGDAHSLALCSDGTVAAWGYNSYGQLGDNNVVQRTVPVAVNTDPGVSALHGKTVVAIAAGNAHSLALCADGTLASWGYNSYGQLGDSTSTPRSAPVAVDAASLAASQRFVRIPNSLCAVHTLAVVAAPPAFPVIQTGASMLTNRLFQFTFTNTPGAFFSVLAATNPALPPSNWTSLTGLTEVLPGQFQFTDPGSANRARRFYRVRSP